MAWRSPFLSFCILSILLIPFLGCATLIGLGVGSAIDSAKEPFKIIAEGDIKKIEPGKLMRLTLNDSTVHTGEFAGFAGYCCNNAQSDFESLLPCRGDSIRVLDPYGRARQTRFGAFYFKIDSGELKSFLELEADSVWVAYNLNLFSGFIKSDGDTVAGSTISAEFGRSELPPGIAILLSNQNETQSFPMMNVAEVKIEPRRNAAEHWAKMGLVIDVIFNTLIFMALRSLNFE